MWHFTRHPLLAGVGERNQICDTDLEDFDVMFVNPLNKLIEDAADHGSVLDVTLIVDDCVLIRMV
jgi:hypothetical protein